MGAPVVDHDDDLLFFDDLLFGVAVAAAVSSETCVDDGMKHLRKGENTAISVFLSSRNSSSFQV